MQVHASVSELAASQYMCMSLLMIQQKILSISKEAMLISGFSGSHLASSSDQIFCMMRAMRSQWKIGSTGKTGP